MDDDVLLNVKKLTNLTQALKSHEDSIYCHLVNDAYPSTEPKEKW